MTLALVLAETRPEGSPFAALLEEIIRIVGLPVFVGTIAVSAGLLVFAVLHHRRRLRQQAEASPPVSAREPNATDEG